MGVSKTSITARALTWNPAHRIRFSVQFWTGDLSKMYPVKLNTILFVQYVAFLRIVFIMKKLSMEKCHREKFL